MFHPACGHHATLTYPRKSGSISGLQHTQASDNVQAEVVKLEEEAAGIALATEEEYSQYQQLKQVELPASVPPLCHSRS